MRFCLSHGTVGSLSLLRHLLAELRALLPLVDGDRRSFGSYLKPIESDFVVYIESIERLIDLMQLNVSHGEVFTHFAKAGPLLPPNYYLTRLILS